MDGDVEFWELENLAGEMLPERAAMSLIDLSGLRININALTTSNNTTYVMPATVSTGDGGTVAYACQATNSPGTPGLLGALGLGSSPSSSLTCVPAAVVSG